MIPISSPSHGWVSSSRCTPGCDPEIGRVAGQRHGSGVGVLDPEEGVVEGAPRGHLPDRLLRRTGQGVPRGVRADGLDQLGRRPDTALDVRLTAAASSPTVPWTRPRRGPRRPARRARPRREPQVDEARPRHVRVRDLGPGRQRRGQPAGQLARRHPDPAAPCAAPGSWRTRRVRGLRDRATPTSAGSAAGSRPWAANTSHAAARTRPSSRAGVTGSILGSANEHPNFAPARSAHPFSAAAPTLGDRQAGRCATVRIRRRDGRWSAARTARRPATPARPW